jgi:hypothetical protein
MGQSSLRMNCLADPQFARIIQFQNHNGSVAAIINRKWCETDTGGSVSDAVSCLQKSGGRMYISFGHPLTLGDMETGHPSLDALAKDRELNGFLVSLSPTGYVSLVEDTIRFEHAVVTIEGKHLADVTLQDVAVKVTTRGDVTFPPYS